jgi:hypothetical protein
MANLLERIFNRLSQREALIPQLREKWQNLAFSTTPIDPETLKTKIDQLYQYLGHSSPEIRYFSSPYQLVNYLLKEFFEQLEPFVIDQIENHLLLNPNDLVESEIIEQLTRYLQSCLVTIETQIFGQKLASKIENLWSNQIPKTRLDKLDQDWISNWDNQLRNTQLSQEINVLNAQHLRYINSQLIRLSLSRLTELVEENQSRQFLGKLLEMLLKNQNSDPVNRWSSLLGKNLFWHNCIYPETWAIANSRLEFYGKNLKLAEKPQINQLFNDLLSQGGWILPFSKTCLIVDRPIKLTLDQENRLHQEQGMAMLYNDGYGVYAYHGVILPKIYGERHPDQWEAEWILQENNVELRRVLIQGIGYDRLCQELNPIELDSWREYTLLCFQDLIDPIDEQPIYLLKMTCPSTGFIHGLRVPPDVKSARDAILWVNWGVDPEEIVMAS